MMSRYIRYLRKLIFCISILFFFTRSSCDKPVSVSPNEQVPFNGMLFVDSYPAGAKIYLDGKNTGFVTSDTIRWLNPKTYSLKLIRDYFLDVNSRIDIKNDSLSTYYYNYITDPQMRGSLNCDSNPVGAEVLLNDSSTGKVTPVLIDNLFPGEYKVTFKLENHRDDSLTINVESGITRYISATLIDTSVWVTYNMQNSGIQTDYLRKVVIENGATKWIATSDGLIKYEGGDFTIYNTNNSGLPDNGIYNLYVDNSGIKWICTFAGLVKFDDYNWTTYDVTNSGIPSDEVTCVSVAPNNEVWAGTFGDGLAKFDGSTWQVYNISNSDIPSNSIGAVTSDLTGNIWVGTIGSGIAEYSSGIWTVYDNTNSGLPASDKVTDVQVKSDGTIWAAFGVIGLSTPGGIAFFNGSTWTSYTSPSTNCTSISFGTDGLVWIGTQADGFASFDGSNFRIFRKNNYPLPSDGTLSMSIDNSGNKWIATNDEGLVKYKGN
jgi:PEGA domain